MGKPVRLKRPNFRCGANQSKEGTIGVKIRNNDVILRRYEVLCGLLMMMELRCYGGTTASASDLE